jgi:hypothetical protein
MESKKDETPNEEPKKEEKFSLSSHIAETEKQKSKYQEKVEDSDAGDENPDPFADSCDEKLKEVKEEFIKKKAKKSKSIEKK